VFASPCGLYCAGLCLLHHVVYIVLVCVCFTMWLYCAGLYVFQQTVCSVPQYLYFHIVLISRNAARLYATHLNTIPFTSTRTVLPSPSCFSPNSQTPVSALCRSPACTEFHTNRTI